MRGFGLTEDQEAIRDGVAKLCADFDDEYWRRTDETGIFPEEFVAAIAQGGWLGVAMAANASSRMSTKVPPCSRRRRALEKRGSWASSGRPAAAAIRAQSVEPWRASRQIQRPLRVWKKLARGCTASRRGRVEASFPNRSWMAMVGDQLRDHILATHPLSAERTLELILGAKERATIDLVDQAGRAVDAKAFAAHLASVGRLTPSLLLRALAHGHMTFFEWGVAELAGVPHHRTWLMIHDAGTLGLKAICERAGLPPRLFPALRAGVDAFHALEYDGRPGDRERFQEHMIQRFLTASPAVSREDADYLLDRADRLHEQAKTAAAG